MEKPIKLWTVIYKKDSAWEQLRGLMETSERIFRTSNGLITRHPKWSDFFLSENHYELGTPHRIMPVHETSYFSHWGFTCTLGGHFKIEDGDTLGFENYSVEETQ